MTGQDASEKTHRIFENYLDARRMTWVPVPLNQGRTPDYRLAAREREALCEVKTIVGSGLLPSGGYDPCKRIVAKIRKARPQLHGAENEPRCLLLHSQSVYDSLEAGIVAAAAFGPGYRDYRHDHTVIDSRPPALRFSRKRELPQHLWHLSNAALSPVCNTAISAIVILSDYLLCDRTLAIWRQLAERQAGGEVIPPGESIRVLAKQHATLPNTQQFAGTVRVIVLENPHTPAARRFPEDLFRGPFDQRWGAYNEDLYGPVWIGSTLEAFYGDGVPFQML
jgi:hypothetical protein